MTASKFCLSCGYEYGEGFDYYDYASDAKFVSEEGFEFSEVGGV